jgi:mRNA-degrading endonuclease toxin of MazEF toxin-antitoxin module
VSSPAPAKYCQGRILQAKVSEARGGYKERPLIIVTPTNEIQGSSFQVIACTTQGEKYPSSVNVPIPGGKFLGISSDSDAVCDWMPQITENDITGLGGILSPKYLRAIIENLRKLKEGN